MYKMCDSFSTKIDKTVILLMLKFTLTKHIITHNNTNTYIISSNMHALYVLSYMYNKYGMTKIKVNNN